MRNLKKVLSLVLALAMVLSICMVGAGAVNYDGFTDEESITKKQAVETLVSLDVIKGYNDGAEFRPAGNVTRAEMATMICRVLAGGDNMIVDATKPVPTYSDVRNNPSAAWAESYIEYCTSLGIVSGKGNGIFDPMADVTAAEAAKMVMTTLGYNADIEGFKGIGWDINTMAKANTLKLLDNLQGEISANTPVTREQVAQLLFNALDKPTVQYYEGTSANVWIGAGNVNDKYYETLLEAKFHAQKLTGVIEANEWADLYGETGIREGTTRLALMDNGGDLTGQKQVVEVSTHLLDIGQSVIVYWNKDTKRVLYGNTQDTGTNVVREFKTGGKFVGGEGLDRNSVKSAEYFVNYSDAYSTGYYSDWRIEYNIVRSLTEYEAMYLLYFNGGDLVANVPNGMTVIHPTTWSDEFAASLDNDAANQTSYVYEKVIRAGDEITAQDMSFIKEIFTAADKEANIILGEVYVGTKSTEDVSDELSYREFYNKYIGTKDRTQAAFDSNENGNYVRAVDFNNDGDFEYIMKIKFEMHEVDNVDKDGDVRFSGVIDGLVDRDGNALDTVEAADLAASGELVKDDVVLTTYIDGKVYVDQAPTFEGKVDSYNMRKDILTVEGTEYEQSEILEYTEYQNRIADAEKDVNYTYYQDHFGYIRVFAYPPEAEGNYVLLTDGWFREKIDENEYAVKAYVDGEIKTYFTTGRTSREFIDDTDRNTMNNSWRNLIAFNEYDTDTDRPGAVAQKYPDGGTDFADAGNTRPHDPKLAVTNIARYTAGDEDLMTLRDVKTYAYDKQHKEINVDVDYVDLLGDKDLTKGQTAFQGYYVMDWDDEKATWFDGVNVDHSEQDAAAPADWSEVTVQATRNTVFYYVTREGGEWKTVKSVKTVTGYRNTLAVAEEDILAMYAVATNTGKDKDGENYWVADVIVIETKGLAAEAKDVFFNVYASEKNSKDIATSDAILETGKTGSLLVKTPSGFDNYNNPGRRIAMDFYTKSEPDADGVVTIDGLKPGEYAKYGIYAAQADRVTDLLTYLTIYGSNGSRKTLEYNSDDVLVYALDSKKLDKYSDPIADAILRQDGKVIDVKPGEKVIAFCNKNDVVYIINVDASNEAVRETLEKLWDKINKDYQTGGADETNSDKIAAAKALTCKDFKPFGTKTAADLDKIIAELVDISTKYNAGKLELGKTDADNLAALLGTSSDGTIYVLKAEITGHQALEDYAGKVAKNFGLTTKSRAVTFADGFEAMVQDRHDAICDAVKGKTLAVATTAVEGIIKYTPAGTNGTPPESWSGSAPASLAQAGLYTALVNAAEATSAGSSKDAGVKTAISGAVSAKSTADDALAAKDMIAADGKLDTTKAATIITAIETASNYVVTIAQSALAGGTNVTIEDGDGYKVDDAAANTLYTGTDNTLTLVVSTTETTAQNIVLTLTQGANVINERVSVVKDQPKTVTFKMPSGGTWALSSATVNEAKDVSFAVKLNSSDSDKAKVMDGTRDITSATKTMSMGDTLSFTVALEDGYKITSVQADGVDVPVVDGTYTFTMGNAASAVTITVTIAIDPAKALEAAKTEAAEAAEAVDASAAATKVTIDVTAAKTAFDNALAAENATAESVNTAKETYVTAVKTAVVAALVTQAGTGLTGEYAADTEDAKKAAAIEAVKTKLGSAVTDDVTMEATADGKVTISFCGTAAQSTVDVTLSGKTT
ncbi:MAG: hypothetical protein HFF18_14425 [Oscillospiraceae bacterium]|nr:hypothetical protein [Oscillospiraceae bacterium]